MASTGSCENGTAESADIGRSGAAFASPGSRRCWLERALHISPSWSWKEGLNLDGWISSNHGDIAITRKKAIDGRVVPAVVSGDCWMLVPVRREYEHDVNL